MLTKTDYWVQLILLIIIGLFVVTIYGALYGFLFAIPLGAWQVISSLLRYFEWKKLLRKEKIKLVVYQIVTATYFILGAIGIEANWVNDYEVVMITLAITVPAALAIFYFVFTRSRYLKVIGFK